MRYVSLANDRVMINKLLSNCLDDDLGLSSWCFVPDRKEPPVDYYQMIEDKGGIIFEDVEYEDEKWILTRDKMIDGFRILDERNQEAFERISRNHGEWGAEDADQWFQYSLFQTIVYS